MGNGGYNSAYNVQLAVDTYSRFIIGVDLINNNSDSGLLPKMFDQVKMRYKTKVDQWLVDKGFLPD